MAQFIAWILSLARPCPDCTERQKCEACTYADEERWI